MVKEAIGYGKTVEEATEAAKKILNAPDTADIKVEVVTMPKKKILGLFGGSDASVKVSYEDNERPNKKNSKNTSEKNKKKKNNSVNVPVKEQKMPVEQKQVKKKTAPAPNVKTEKPKEKVSQVKEAETKPETSEEKPAEEKPAVVITQEDIDSTTAYLEEILKGLKVEDAVVKGSIKDDTIELEVKCDDYGIIIGHRGETLEAIQYLTSISTKNSATGYKRVVLNIANYRERRDKALAEMARKNAMFVQRTHRKYVFEPMNAYERRIIHTRVQDIEGVDSYSTGSGLDMKVILVAEGSDKRQKQYEKRDSQYKRTSQPRTSAPRADRADLPKFGKIEIPADKNKEEI